MVRVPVFRTLEIGLHALVLIIVFYHSNSMSQRTHEESARNSRTARRSVHDTSTHTARRIERPHARTTGAGSTRSGTSHPMMDLFTIRIPILWWINSSSGSGTANLVLHRAPLLSYVKTIAAYMRLVNNLHYLVSTRTCKAIWFIQFCVPDSRKLT